MQYVGIDLKSRKYAPDAPNIKLLTKKAAILTANLHQK